VAASDEPPPSPPPTGRFFSRLISRGADAKILLAEDSGKPDLVVVPRRKSHPVASVDQAKDRLQLVVARMFPSIAAAEDVKEQVQLARRRVPGQFHAFSSTG
jgi:hypothetical protein